MRRRIVPVSLNNFNDLPDQCRSCLYWEYPIKPGSGSGPSPDGTILKEEWFSTTLLQWGECGKLFYQGDRALAYAQYSPALYLPRTMYFRAAPPSVDAVFLSCLFVVPEVRGRGLGRVLLRAIERDLYKRKFKAIETFASKYLAEKPPGPIEFYLKNGFYILRDDEEFPLLRLDFKSLVFWQENLEAALESLKVPTKADIPVPS